MAPYFFRVEHELLRSESFKTLGGSAIKVYLVIGLYSDFGTDWAYPSIRTIARQGGLSRQTVLAAIEELSKAGLLVMNKSKGRSTAYKIMRVAPSASRPTSASKKEKNLPGPAETGPISFGVGGKTVPDPLEVPPETGPESFEALAQFLGPGGPDAGPKREPGTREDTTGA